VGCLKNVVTTYGGMYYGGDYIYSFANLAGVNMSLGGSLLYAYYNFSK
jgi:solute carrier family 35 protein